MLLPDCRERDARAEGARRVGCGLRLGQELQQRRLASVAVAEPHGQLEVREAELASRLGVELGAALEVVGGDGELGSQLAQRLDRGLPRAGFDSGDVGVRDARSGQFPL